MGTIEFIGEGPFELLPRGPITASPQDDTIILTLPIFRLGDPDHSVNVRIPLSIKHAERLAAQIQPALTMAQVRDSAEP